MSEELRKVLVVAYAFPPAGGAGVQRPLKFVKYLRRFGWEPSVLTVANPSVPTWDEGLLKDLPEGIKIHKARTLEPSYEKKAQLAGEAGGKAGSRQQLKGLLTKIIIPDVQVLWWPGLVAKLVSVLQKQRPDAVFVTAPPFSSLIPVVVLGKLFRVPVVVDFRDEWVFARDNIEHAGRGRLLKICDFWLERLTVLLCANFTAATQSYVDSIQARHPGAARGKGLAITNGYDEDDFAGIARKREPDGIYRIVYTGTVWKATSLEPFVKGLLLLLDERPELKQTIRLRVIGRIVESELTSLQPLQDLEMLEIFGYHPHKKVLQELVDADLLLLTLSDLPGAERIIPGKTFEYMAARNSVLCICHSGETSKIMEGVVASSIVEPNRSNKIKNLIKEHLLHSDTNEFSEKNDFIKQYSRAHLTNALVNVLNKY